MGVSVQNFDYQEKANNVFTDRVEPRKAFWSIYNRYKENMNQGIHNDIQILTYYGIGGVGKSTLLLKLQEELESYAKKENTKCQIPYVYYDIETNSSKLGILANLKYLLASKYGFKFPLFNLALNVYLIKTGNEPILEEKEGLIDNKYAGIATDIMGAGVDALNIIPVAGALASNAIKLVDSLITGHKKRYAKHQLETSDLQQISPNEIWKKLQFYFAKDLAESVKEIKYPIVIFLDTYEQLVNELASVGEPLLNDDWLRDLRNGLVTHTQNCIWVIAGREIIKWDQFYPDWKDSIEQHLIGNLSEVDVKSFLEASGITDFTMQQQIYSITKGTPVYLDICVSNYYYLLQTGGELTKEKLGKDDKELIARFLKYTDDNKKDILYLLSCLEEWTEEDFLNASAKCLKTVSYSSIEKIKEYSFIETNDGKLYRMHQIIRSVLGSYCPKSIKREVVSYQINSLREQMNQIDFRSRDYTKRLKQYIAVCLQLEDIKDKEEAIYEEIYEKYIKSLFEHFQYNESCNILELFVQYIERSEDESILKARIFIDYTKCLLSAKQYNNILDYAQKAVAIFRTSDLKNDLINANIILSQVYSKLERHEEAIELADKMLTLRFEERREKKAEVHDAIAAQRNLGDRFSDAGYALDAVTLYEKVLSNCTKFYGEQAQDTVEAINTLADLYNSVGRDQDALNMIEKSIELTGNNFALMIPILQIQFKYTNKGSHQEALKVSQRIYDIFVKFFGEDDIRTINEMASLAINYLDAGKEEEAIIFINKYLDHVGNDLDCEPLKVLQTIEKRANHLKLIEKYQIALRLFQTLYELKVKLYGELNPETVQLLKDMASINIELKDLDHALNMYEKYTDCLKKQNGQDAPETINSLRNIAEMYISFERFDEAFQVYEKMKASFVQNYGEEYSDTLRVDMDIADLFRQLNQLEEACQRYEKGLELSIRVLGEKHSLTFRIMESLSYLYWNQDKTFEAAALFEKVYLNKITVYGPEHRIIFRAAQHLAMMYCRIEKYQEAADIMKEIYELRKSKYGADNEKTIQVVRELVDIYCQSQKYQDALRLGKQLYESKIKIHGVEHSETVEESFYLARTYSKCKKYQEALNISSEAIDLSKRLFGNEHMITIDAVNSLAFIYCDMGDQEAAISTLLKNLEIEKKVFGNERLVTLDALEYAYKKAGKMSEAKEISDRSEFIFKNL